MSTYHGSALLSALVADVKSAWGLSDDVIYLEPPRSPLGLPYAVVALESFAQELAYPDAARGAMLQTYTFTASGIFAREGSGNAVAQQTRIAELVSGLTAEPVAGLTHDRYVSQVEIRQTEFDGEPVWLVQLTIIYTVFEEV